MDVQGFGTTDTSSRLGEYIQTHSGTLFYPADPREDEIHLDDIAHALSMQCRFGGHAPFHYSVAQHSILCAEQAMIECPNLALTVLMHDAAEAYLVDLPRPIKKMLTGYYAMEHLIEEVIATKFNLFFPFPDVVRSIDNRMLCTEGKAFFDQFENKWWEQPTYGAEIYGHIKIEKWSPLLAEQRFRQMFKMLA